MLFKFSQSHAKLEVVEVTVQSLEPGAGVRGGGAPALPSYKITTFALCTLT